MAGVGRELLVCIDVLFLVCVEKCRHVDGGGLPVGDSVHILGRWCALRIRVRSLYHWRGSLLPIRFLAVGLVNLLDFLIWVVFLGDGALNKKAVSDE